MPHIIPADVASFILAYGYPSLILLGALEGEVALVLGGIAAHAGLLSLPAVIGLSLAGSIFADLVWFFLGRSFGGRILARSRRLGALSSRIRGFVHRRPKKLAFWSRFLYGLRHVVPFSVGMSEVPVLRFLVPYLAGAVIWGGAVGLLGYFAGGILLEAFGSLKRYRVSLIIIAVGMGWLAHSIFARWRLYLERKTREAGELPEGR